MRHFELCKWEDIIVFWLRRQGMTRLSADYKSNQISYIKLGQINQFKHHAVTISELFYHIMEFIYIRKMEG